MKSDVSTISIIDAGGLKGQDYSQLIKETINLRLLHEVPNLETFWARHEEMAPDLVLVGLNGSPKVPDWLGPFINCLPNSEVIVCSERVDSEFLLQILGLSIRHFIPYPLTRDKLEVVIKEAQTRRRQLNDGRNVSKVMAITGSRGGLGTSAVATNLSLAMAEQAPGRVVLVDLGRPFPAVGQFLNLKGTHTIMDLARVGDSLDPLFMGKILQKYKSNLSVLLGNSDLTLDPFVLLDPQALGKIFKALRSAFDWIVVDLGIWPDSLYLKVLQEADLIVLLTELTVQDLENLGKMKTLFHCRDLDQSKVKVVVNRYKRGEVIGLKDLERIASQPAFFTLPTDRASLLEAINQGEPIATVAPKSKFWSSIKELTMEILRQSQEMPQEKLSKRGWLHRFVSPWADFSVAKNPL